MNKENKISKLTFNLKEKDMELAEIVTELNKQTAQFAEYERSYEAIKNQRNQFYEENQVLVDRHNAHNKTTEILKQDIKEKELTAAKYKESLELLKR